MRARACACVRACVRACVCVCVCVCDIDWPLLHVLIGYETLCSMGKLKAVSEGGEGGDVGEREDVLCDRVPEDGMRSDGETSDRTEEERSSAQVEGTHTVLTLHLAPSLYNNYSLVAFTFLSPLPPPPPLPSPSPLSLLSLPPLLPPSPSSPPSPSPTHSSHRRSQSGVIAATPSTLSVTSSETCMADSPPSPTDLSSMTSTSTCGMPRRPLCYWTHTYLG